jgi:ABC-type multidrug transport system fused ATPase/permease subunit
VITIAHRLSTIRDANTIIVLSGGVVAEQGTHQELLALGGVYAELHRIQVEGVSETIAS